MKKNNLTLGLATVLAVTVTGCGLIPETPKQTPTPSSSVVSSKEATPEESATPGNPEVTPEASFGPGEFEISPMPSASGDPDPESTITAFETVRPQPVKPPKPVPAPAGGNIKKTVKPPKPAPTKKVKIEDKAEVVSEISAKIVGVKAINVVPNGPGEVGGPGVAVTVQVDNKTKQDFDLELVSVNLTDSKGLPGSGMTGSPASWLEGTLKAGSKKSGVYVFTVPSTNRKPVKVELSLRPDLPMVLFSGNVS